MKAKKRTEKFEDLLSRIKECIRKGHYLVTAHAFVRQNERIKTLREEKNVRVIVAFDENNMLIITVMHIGGR